MIETTKLSAEELLKIAQYAFVRMDGAWFLSLAKKHGIQEAWEMDVEAWSQFSYVFGKYLRKNVITEPAWPEGFLGALDILSEVLGIAGRSVELRDGEIIVRVTECQTQKAIAKAGVADCGIVTVQTYQGLARGLFGGDAVVEVRHTKNLNRGDGVCEVVVRQAAPAA
ncbi:MAG: DUF6125 family protein [Spirochaetes bacterium]|jgi:hypothetical protein|nr:DUF6125 family protein [Spirochaetota bacterium]